MTAEEEKTIVALSTPTGSGGIAVVRMSGPDAVGILAKAWKGKDPGKFESHTAHVGWIKDADGKMLDQVVVTLFRAPNSFTGEDVVEISCHGSRWIQQAIVARMTECGATPAGPGEFTMRAFLNGRIDLAQAEGIADMIAASSKASAKIAASQLRGEYSKKLRELRGELLDLGVLLELELDFSEEDVEFADRGRLIATADRIYDVVSRLAGSFRSGNAFKNGVPVAIAGVPNAGKSTLLNALLGEEKAIVSDIPGTTRDAIEDTVEFDGILYRFIDTAGLRQSDDKIEKIGIEKAKEKVKNVDILIYLIDPEQEIESQLDTLSQLPVSEDVRVIKTISKSDVAGKDADQIDGISISAKTGDGIKELKKRLTTLTTENYNPDNELIVTNARHHHALTAALSPLQRLREGLTDGTSADFLAQDLREVVSHLGEITGEVTSDEILHSIFARYCIGK